MLPQTNEITSFSSIWTETFFSIFKRGQNLHRDCVWFWYGEKILGSQFCFEWVWNIIQKSLKKDPSVFDKQDKKPQTKNSNLSGNLIGQMTKITLNEKK